MTNVPIYSCPVCQEELRKQEKQYICANNHSFDLARKGYVNLLLANQKHAKDPGDSKEMIISRRDFLNKGYYELFSDSLNQAVLSLIASEQRDELNILDAGCGEGYFTYRLKQALEKLSKEVVFWGIDISKTAINCAASRDKEINFAVASNHNLPILPEALDYIVWTFAPGNEAEFSRVLKTGGKLIVAIPGQKHLFGLKELVYEQAREHEPKDTSLQGFELLSSSNVTYSISLEDSQDVINLLAMTPYYWHITAEGKKRAEQAKRLETEVDFLILIYKKIGGEEAIND